MKKNAFTLAEVFYPVRQSKRIAFTLAEVLITLGIIGVVAALSMPSLINNHQKKQTEVKLKRFYSIMSQAIQRYFAEEEITAENYSVSEYYTFQSEDAEKWYNNSIGKFINSIYKGNEDNINYKVGLNDGSGFVINISGDKLIYLFYCTELKYCKYNTMDGRNTFLFSISNGKLMTGDSRFDNYTREELLQECKFGNTDNVEVSTKGKRHACARLIQTDGWEIKDDYPWKQVMLEN